MNGPVCHDLVWRGRPVEGEMMSMAGNQDPQAQAARLAAKARQTIARRIAELVPDVQDDGQAQVVLNLAEAYAHLASEPPRVRAP